MSKLTPCHSLLVLGDMCRKVKVFSVCVHVLCVIAEQRVVPSPSSRPNYT